MKYEKSKKGDGVKILDIKNKYDRVMFEISLSMNIGLKKRYLCFLFYIYLEIKLFGEKVFVYL